MTANLTRLIRETMRADFEAMAIRAAKRKPKEWPTELVCQQIADMLGDMIEGEETMDDGGYRDAFYELASLMGIGARAASPKDVWEREILPRLKEALSRPAVREAALEEAARLCEHYVTPFGRAGSDPDMLEGVARTLARAIRALSHTEEPDNAKG